MTAKKSAAAEQLAAIKAALRREIQLNNAIKEVDDKIVVLQRQRTSLMQEQENLQDVLAADPEMTAISRQMMADALKLQGAGTTDFAIYNPKYVSSEDKEKLLEKILADYAAENEGNRLVKGMPFSAIKAVLANRYGIQTDSTGVFFRNQIKDYELVGGNRNKKILLHSKKQSKK